VTRVVPAGRAGRPHVSEGPPVIFRKLALLLGCAVFVVAALQVATILSDRRPFAIAEADTQAPGCEIKGNIDRSGNRIYYLPDSRYYASTVIDATAGERWFCNESDAEAAGWDPSPR
jgi:hypothetical protein